MLLIIGIIALLCFLADPVGFIGFCLAIGALALAGVVTLATLGACWLVLS